MSRRIEMEVCHARPDGVPIGASRFLSSSGVLMILEAAADLAYGDLLVLHLAFEPVSLYGVMRSRGFCHAANQVGEHLWIVTFAKLRIGDTDA